MGSQVIASNALYIMALLPLTEVVLFGTIWRSQEHPYIFVGVALVALYPIMYACVSPILTAVGFSGGRPGAPSLPAITAMDIRYLKAFAIFIASSVAFLWALRYALNKV